VLDQNDPWTKAFDSYEASLRNHDPNAPAWQPPADLGELPEAGLARAWELLTLTRTWESELHRRLADLRRRARFTNAALSAQRTSYVPQRVDAVA
jgi:hypothetical protein